jgi:hypothetical protein
MDVDATKIDVATAKLVVHCFYCNNKGHMKRNCYKHQAAQERERGPEREKPPQKTKAQATAVEEDKEGKETKEGPPAYNPESLMVHIKNMKIEDHDDFLDCLLVQDTEGF